MVQGIVIMGIFVADAAFTAPRLPVLGETLLGSAFAVGPGGKGSNQAIAAARAGGEAHFVTRLGRDAFGDLAQKTWTEAGVRQHVILSDNPTGAAFIFLEEATGQNAIIVSAGAAAELSPSDMTDQRELIADAAVFMTQLEAPIATAQAGLQIAHDARVTTILNPAPAASLPEGMLALCDLVTPNESEAEGLTGVAVADLASAANAADALKAQGAGAAIITLGAQGAWIDAGGQAKHIPARDAGPVVDTTGAGDAFNGALAVALAEGATVFEAAEFATAAAALSVSRAGAGGSMAARAEIDALLADG